MSKEVGAGGRFDIFLDSGHRSEYTFADERFALISFMLSVFLLHIKFLRYR